jgi:hypothetical protein
LGSESNTPRYYGDPAWYYIPTNPLGRVWINELNYINDGDPAHDTNEFVEICGPAGFNIGNWQVKFYLNSDIYGAYTIPSGTVLSNISNGYGFYVLGDFELSIKNMTLIYTNMEDETHIADGSSPSGIMIINEGNQIEQSLSYEGDIQGFSFLPAREYSEPDPYSLQLAGEGTYYTNFTWRTNSMTPGAVNVGQSFGSGPNPSETNAAVEIWNISCATQITITAAFTNAVGWVPDAFYVTKLVPSPQTSDWILISPRQVTTNIISTDAGLWSIQFAYPSDLPAQTNCYFRVKAKK